MKIKIAEDAYLKYIAACVESHRRIKHEYGEQLVYLEGKWIDVDTRFLFKDQFNTAPIPNVANNGVRIPIEYVDEIEDDERINHNRCSYCGYKTLIFEKQCHNCLRTEYLEPLRPE